MNFSHFEVYARSRFRAPLACWAYTLLVVLAVVYGFLTALVWRTWLVVETDAKASLFVRLKPTANTSALPRDLPPYCSDPSQCKFLDELSVVHSNGGLVSITTRTTTELQVRECPQESLLPHLDCPDAVWTTIGSTSHTTVAPELYFDVCVQHSVRAKGMDKSSLDMPGYLVPTTGNPSLVSPLGKTDCIPLNALLGADGLSLDAPSDAGKKAGRTFRKAGVVAAVDVRYTNDDPGRFTPSPTLSYSYSVHHIPRTSYRRITSSDAAPAKVAALFPDVKLEGREARFRTKEYGVQLQWTQTSHILSSSVASVLQAATSSLFLLTVPYTVLEMLLAYCRPGVVYIKEHRA